MLQKVLCTFLLFVSSLTAFSPKATILYDEEGNPSSALLQVLDYYELPHDGSWENILRQTQKYWLRKEGKERWDLVADCPQNPILEYQLFHDLNMVQENKPIFFSYDNAVILGTTVQKLRESLYFLKEQWDRGVKFNSLILLGSERPLNPIVESENVLINPETSPFPFRKDWQFDGVLPITESQMMLFVLNQMDLPLAWRDLPLTVVDTPMKIHSEGKLVRPNTEDTFFYWLTEHKPIPACLLIVSHQPFIGRQDSTARNALPFFFPLETIGCGISFEQFACSKHAIPILLDDLARWIYTVRTMDPKRFSRLNF